VVVALCRIVHCERSELRISGSQMSVHIVKSGLSYDMSEEEKIKGSETKFNVTVEKLS
jgi:hypothetical protein